MRLSEDILSGECVHPPTVGKRTQTHARAHDARAKPTVHGDADGITDAVESHLGCSCKGSPAPQSMLVCAEAVELASLKQ